MVTPAIVVKGRLTLPLPCSLIKTTNIPKLRLGDPNFNIPSDLEIIIGAEPSCESLRIGKTVKLGNLHARNQVFGYVVYCKINSKKNSPTVNHIMTPRYDCFQKLWATEELPL